MGGGVFDQLAATVEGAAHAGDPVDQPVVALGRD
jgi:hypothetical protein